MLTYYSEIFCLPNTFVSMYVVLCTCFYYISQQDFPNDTVRCKRRLNIITFKCVSNTSRKFYHLNKHLIIPPPLRIELNTSGPLLDTMNVLITKPSGQGNLSNIYLSILVPWLERSVCPGHTEFDSQGWRCF